MLALGLSLLLAVAAVAVFPCWRHSAGWGYGPSLVAALLMVLVAVVAAGGKPSVAEAFVKRSDVPVRLSAEEVRMANAAGSEPVNAF